jgi:hypothetical protein
MVRLLAKKRDDEVTAAGSVKRAQDSLREHLSRTLAQAEEIRKAHPGNFRA